jgi:hypothetical protein
MTSQDEQLPIPPIPPPPIALATMHHSVGRYGVANLAYPAELVEIEGVRYPPCWVGVLNVGRYYQALFLRTLPGRGASQRLSKYVSMLMVGPVRHAFAPRLPLPILRMAVYGQELFAHVWWWKITYPAAPVYAEICPVMKGEPYRWTPVIYEVPEATRRATPFEVGLVYDGFYLLQHPTRRGRPLGTTRFYEGDDCRIALLQIMVDLFARSVAVTQPRVARGFAEDISVRQLQRWCKTVPGGWEALKCEAYAMYKNRSRLI